MAGKIGIDIGSSCLKFAQLVAEKQEIKIERVISFPLPGSEEENFSKPCALQLKEYLRKENFKVREGLAGISGKHLNMRYLQVPSTNETRIAQIVEMEMAQVLEKANTPLAYSYVPLNLALSEKQQGCVVAIAVVYESFLQSVWNFFAQAGIKIQAFVPNCISLYHAFVRFSQPPSKETSYIVDIGYENTNVVLMQGDRFCFARNVSMGSKMITLKIQEEKNWEFEEADKFKIQKVNLTSYDDYTIARNTEDSFEEKLLNTAQKIPDALQASLKFARVQTGIASLKVDRIYLTGGGACQKGMKALIQSSFVCPVESIAWKSPLGDFFKEESQKYFFANSLGLSYLADQKKIPLKILSYNQKIQELLFGKHLFEYLSVAVVFLLVVFSLWSTYACHQRYQKWEDQLNEKYQKISERSLKAKEFQKNNEILQNKLSLIQDRLLPNKSLLEILSWLNKSIPSQMYIHKLEWNFSSKLLLSLSGFVEEGTEDVYIVLKRFKESIKKHPFLAIEEERDPQIQEQDRKLEFFLRLKIVKKD